MNRQRAGRGATSRDSSKAGSEVDVEAIKAQVREGMIKAQEYNDKARDIALQIIALERDFEAKSSRECRPSTIMVCSALAAQETSA